MGPFTYITCETELPLNEEAKGEDFKGVEWDKFEFQTKSIINDDDMFCKYNISEDGQFYKERVNCDLELDDNSEGTILRAVEKGLEGIEKQEVTSEILFSGLHLGKKYDYWMEFKALFWKGELKELTLENWEKEETSERIKIQKNLEKKVEIYEASKKKMSFKFKLFYRTIFSKIFYVIKWILNYLFKLTHRIESWIHGI